MDLNLVSKNNLGVVVALLLAVILSQARFFNFLLDTALGRAILILFILFISYANQILGVVAVLFIIIMFNNSDIGYMEGFTAPDANATNSSAAAVSIQNNMNSKKSAPASTPPAPTPPAPSPTPPASSSAAAANLIAKIKDRVASNGAEGFDILGAERNMQLGKKSNSIPANKQVNGDGVMPFDSSFSNLFSAFK